MDRPITPDYLSQLSAQERNEINMAIGTCLLYGVGIIRMTTHLQIKHESEVGAWYKRTDGQDFTPA